MTAETQRELTKLSLIIYFGYILNFISSCDFIKFQEFVFFIIYQPRSEFEISLEISGLSVKEF